MFIDVPVKTPRGRSYLMRTIAEDHITSALKSGAFYEARMLEWIRELHLEGTFVDVGAHIGNHSVYFAGECEAGYVFALEPNEDVLPALQENARRHGQGRIEILNRAVHDSFKAVDLLRHGGNTGHTVSVEGSRIPTVSLDEVPSIREHGPVALIKIDVEGQEPAVLRSARGLIQADRPVIVAEAQQPALMKRLDALLPPGYSMYGPFNQTPTYVWLPPGRHEPPRAP